jgi:hypothetical protein
MGYGGTVLIPRSPHGDKKDSPLCNYNIIIITIIITTTTITIFFKS